VVVGDNGSTDDTADLARRAGAVVVVEPRRGVCFARQAALDAALGDIVVSTDADTSTPPSWLRSLDERFSRPGVVGVAGPCHYVDGPWWSGPWQQLLFGGVGLVARLTGHVGYVTATNLAFRRDAFDGYDTRLTQGGDELDVLRRLQARGRVVFAPEIVTSTSARRLERGLAYNLVVSLGYYYVLGYWVNRLAGRTILGTAPSVRPDRRRRWVPPAVTGAAVAATVVLLWNLAQHGSVR
jgi:glycosyltransferase involved in cell wall biosynthesis